MALFSGLFTSQPAATSPSKGTGPFGGLFPAPKPSVGASSSPGATPTSSPASTPATGGIPASALKGSLGGGYGASTITDKASGKPLLTYENTKANASQLLSDRTAPPFDPTVPQKVDPSLIKNGRMPESVSQTIKANLAAKGYGAEALNQLDHIVPLELGGSNEQSNLQMEPTVKGVNTATDPLENQLARDAANGKIAYQQAWEDIAKAKGITLPEQGGVNPPANQPHKNPNAAQDFWGNIGNFFNNAVQGTKSFLENAITSFAPFQVLARVNGGESIAQAIMEQYGARGYQALNGQDIQKIIAERQNLIDSGTPADQATKLAVSKVKSGKINTQLLGSVFPESDLADAGKAIEDIAKSSDPAAIAKSLKSTGVPESNIPTLSKALVNVKDPEAVKAVLNGVAHEAPATEAAAKTVTEPPPKPPEASLPAVAVDKQAQDEAVTKTVAGKGSGVKALDKETAQAYRDWVNYGGQSNKAISGKIAAKQFEDLRPVGMDAVKAFQSGDRTGQLANVETFMNDLLAKEQKAGIPVEKKANYLPQYWANSDAEIRNALQKYNGGSLSLRPGFTKDSLFPTYEEGMKAGLTPKYTTVPDMVNARVRASEKALADRKFYDFMASHNLIQPSSKVREGWTQLDPKFPVNAIKMSDGTIYRGSVSAPSPLAELINNQLRGAQGTFERGLRAVANFASKLKNVVLSAGIPGTAINLHGFNELAATVPEAVNQPSLFTSALQYMLYPKAAGSFIEDNLKLAQEAARDGLTLSAEDHAFDKLGGQQIAKGAIGTIGKLLQKGSDTLYSLFGKHDFQQMIPALKLKMYSDLKQMLIDQGESVADAGRAAAEKANNTFGGVNYAALGRDKNLQNFLRAVVFAPDFWESRLRYAGSLGKSLLSSKDPLAATYRKAVATIVGSYIGMNVWNKKNTGHYMFQNPAGHQMDVWVGKDSQGKDVWLRPFGTDLDFARLPLDIAKSAAEGDISPVTSLIRNRVSTILQPIISFTANVDAYGNSIFGPTNQVNTPGKQAASFASTLPVVPQIIAGTSMLGQPNKSTAQSISTAVSLPVRFNAPAPGSTTSNLADMIYTVRPQLQSQIKKDYLAGNDQAALNAMATYNKNLLQLTIKAYKDNGYNITDEKAFTSWLITTTRANGGLKDVFLKPPGTKAMSNAQKKQGQPLFNKIFPATIQ